MRSGNVIQPIDPCKTRFGLPVELLSQANAVGFAALPHALRRDPRLRGQDKAVLLAAALLEYARGKTSCWPSNRRLADDMPATFRELRSRTATTMSR